MEFKGIIETVNPAKTKTGKDTYSLKIDGQYFSGFGESPAKQGDDVIVDYVENQVGDKTFKNIGTVTVTKASPVPKSTQESIEGTAFLRRRTDCMRMAIDLVIAKDISTEQVYDKAEDLFKWVESSSPQ